LVDIIWIIALIAFAVWWFIIADLDRAGILKKHNFSAVGPLLILRTYRGQKLLDWIAKPKKLWRTVITAGLPIVFISMVGMLALVVFACVSYLMNMQNVPAPSAITNPRNALAIPGINQFIPFWWGWLALVIGMVVHEFSHAIMAKAEGIKVKSLGLLLIPAPIGAFAEIDEEELFGTKSEDSKSEIIGPLETKAPGEGKRKSSTMQFVRIISAGVIANFVVFAIAFALLFGPVLGSIAATSNNVYIFDVTPGSLADQAGIQPNTLVTAVNGMNVTTGTAFDSYLSSVPNSTVVISGIYNSEPAKYTVHVGGTGGVYIENVTSATSLPAYAAGLTSNMRITAINGTAMANDSVFMSYMANTTPGQLITVTAIDQNNAQKDYPLILGSGSGTKGYIGITTLDDPIGLTVDSANAQAYLNGLKSMPFSLLGWVRIIYMPFLQLMNSDPGLDIFHTPYASMFTVTGWLAPLGTHLYDLIDCLYWIGWLNFMLATFNCLPMIPMDGGHVFREVLRRIIEPVVKDRAKADRICGAIVNGFAVTLLAAILFMVAAPYLVHWSLG
jgi:membrane-associated protease RseP (regulator of RpoE activity)